MTNEVPISTEPKTDPYDPTLSINTASKNLEMIFESASVQAVYAAPIQNGETIVVPSAEIFGMAGFGYGTGGGKDEKSNAGGGGGGGGWGRTFSRPVAAVVITPTSVRVEPIVDVTKIGLAALTTIGFMFAMIGRINRRAHR